MGFLDRQSSRKRKNIVPDLSRYENQRSSASYKPTAAEQNAFLINSAAMNASRTYSLNGTSVNYVYGSQSRSNSLSNGGGGRAGGSGRGGSSGAYGYRSNSLLSNHSFQPHLSAPNTQYRSNSLNLSSRQQFQSFPGSYRSNSLTSNSSVRSSGSRQPTEKIVITKTTDEHGRTKSITTETIKQLGSFEIRKTETKNIDVNDFLPPPISGGNNYAGSLLSNEYELGSIAEETEEDENALSSRSRSKYRKNKSPVFLEPQDQFRVHEPNRSVSPVRSILKKKSSVQKLVLNDGAETPDNDSDGNSVYSDAVEVLPVIKKRDSSGSDNIKITENVSNPSSANSSNNTGSMAQRMRTTLKAEPQSRFTQTQNQPDQSLYSSNRRGRAGSQKSPTIVQEAQFQPQSPLSYEIQRQDTESSNNSATYQQYTPQYAPQYSQRTHSMSSQTQYHPQLQPQPQAKRPTEQEMYEKAYQIALQKVYGDKSDQQQMPMAQDSKKFKTYSLRSRKNPVFEPPSVLGADDDVASTAASVKSQPLVNTPLRTSSRTSDSPHIERTTSHRSTSDPQNSAFRKHTFRNGIKGGSKKNYNYQLFNKFSSEKQQDDEHNQQEQEHVLNGVVGGIVNNGFTHQPEPAQDKPVQSYANDFDAHADDDVHGATVKTANVNDPTKKKKWFKFANLFKKHQ